MGDAGDDARFVAEAFDPAAWRVHELAREQLDGDGPIESRVASPIDFTHASGAQRGQDFEWAKSGSRNEPHGRRRQKCRQKYSDALS
jgi:hypothetical protein